MWARLCSKELCQANAKRTHVFQSFCSSRCNWSGCVHIWGNIEEENMHILHGLGWQFQFCCQYFAEALTFKVDWCCHHDSTLCISTESKSRWIYWGMEESDSAKKFIDGKNLQIQYSTIPLMSSRYTFPECWLVDEDIWYLSRIFGIWLNYEFDLSQWFLPTPPTYIFDEDIWYVKNHIPAWTMDINRWTKMFFSQEIDVH